MKPILLRMTAFGSYAKETSIDFEKLGNSLYLITGDTGAGKTTIFDAILFTLYGEVSGSHREPQMMHSDYVSKGEETVVDLTFSHCGKNFNVRRTIKFSGVRGKKGEYSDKPTFDAVLEEEGKDPISGATKVTNRVTELLGLSSTQFQQIIMLAQGEFAKFLSSDNRSRGEILSKLFDSSPYVRFQNLLAGAQKQLGDRIKTDRDRFGDYMATAFILPEGIGEEERNLYSAFHPELAANLQTLVNDDREKLAEMDKEKDRLRHAYETVLTSREPAAQQNSRLDALAGKKLQLEQLLAYDNEFNTREKTMENVRQAVRGVLPYELELCKTNREYSVKEGQLQILENSLEEKLRIQAAANENYGKIQEIEDQAGDFHDRAEKIRHTFPEYDNAISVSEDLANANEKQLSAEERWMEAQSRSNANNVRLAEIRKSLEELENAETEYAAADKKHQMLADRGTDLNKIKIEIGKISAGEIECTGLNSRLQAATAEVAAAGDVANDLYKAFIRGQAGIMAEELKKELDDKDEVICTVCGSTLHKGHAHFTHKEDGVPTEEQVQKAKSEFEQKDSERQDILNKYTQKKAEVEANKTALMDSIREICGAEVSWDEVSDGVWIGEEVRKNGEDLADAKRELQLLKEKTEKKSKLLEEQKTRTLNPEELTGKIKELLEKKTEWDGKVSSLTSQLDEIKKHLTYESKGEAIQEVTTLEANENDLREKSAAIKSNKQKADNEVHLAQGSVTTQESNLKDLESKRSSCEDALNRALSESGFGTLDSYHQALLPVGEDNPENWLENERKAIDRHRNDIKNLSNEVKGLEEETKDYIRRDLDEVDSAIGEAKKLYDEYEEKYNQCRDLLNNHQKAQTEEESYRNKVGKTSEVLGKIDLMATYAGGNTSVEGGKLSFERYVLGAAFKEILAQANHRLSITSGGRYELLHRNTGTSKSSVSGFDIDVLDNMTGKQRSAGSISGGETFQVSLALALGLSDVVQNHAGATAMESMFIDEGFGSLDGGVLDNAIRVLEDLSGRSRQIGIISHVDKLQGSIERKIVVKNGTDGKGSNLTIV